MSLNSLSAAAFLTVLSAAPLAAHEFWIAPEAYQIAPGDEMRANIRVGENFAGSTYAYLPRNFERFEVACGENGFVPVEGRPGDRPALNKTADMPGLCVVVHQTRDYTLTYTQWEKFVNFVTHKDATWAIDTHLARNLPKEKFREVYSRYGKSLIGVGGSKGQDRVTGLLTEIVAEANPYTDDLRDGFPVQVLFENAPRADVQIELFEKAPDGTVDVTLHRTDIEGRAVLPVKPGREYLVDSVVIRAVTPVAENDPVWESLWASLTFKVPAVAVD